MIQKKFKSEKMQRKIVDFVNEQYEAKKNDRQILERRWNTYYELYRGLRTKGTYSGRADLDWAAAYQAIEILVPRIYNVLFPRKKWFDIVGVEQTDEKQAQILAAYLRQKFERDVHFRRKMIPAIRYCAIFGTIIGKTPYRKEKQMVKSRGEFGDEEKEVITFDSIDFELVDLFDFYVADDHIEDLNDQPYVIHKTVEFLPDMEKEEYDEETGFGKYENLDDIELKEEMSYGGEDDFRETQRKTLGLQARSDVTNPKMIKLVELQGYVDVDGVDEKIVAIVANDMTLISAEVLSTPDLEKTYIKGVWNAMHGEFYGMSALERVERQIYELNDRVNQTMDTTAQVVNPMWINTDAQIPEGTLRTRPGRVIRAAAKDALTPLHPPIEILGPAYKALEALTANIQDTTGATRFLGGSAQVPELQRTATGILSIIREANARLNLVIQGLEDSLVIPFLRKSYKYAQYYGERNDVVRIVGKQGIEYQQVKPNDILGDYDFRPLGSQSVGNEEIMTQQMINYLNIIAQIPAIAQQFDILKLAAKIGEKMLGLEEMDELILVNNREQEEFERATSENQATMSGVPPVVQANDFHRLHLEIHNGFLQAPEAQDFPQAIQMLTTHIEDHNKYESGQGMQPVYNQGNRPSAGQGGGGEGNPGVPPQSQPSPTNMQSIVNQISQPSQAGNVR